ncbi:hypothetical protein BDZ85DRAFT_284388 [Elsinoe ampelina]|uniref:Uncharacterized protein n=1 Tax=Elsinoe ampelina TaxID=302913 RepID=A0A6A6G4K7_9PEZI|nr:hypothetical protein BDZ85DRAFT_284388 [Elsinoe ampelina]
MFFADQFDNDGDARRRQIYQPGGVEPVLTPTHLPPLRGHEKVVGRIAGDVKAEPGVNMTMLQDVRFTIQVGWSFTPDQWPFKEDARCHDAVPPYVPSAEIPIGIGRKTSILATHPRQSTRGATMRSPSMCLGAQNRAGFSRADFSSRISLSAAARFRVHCHDDAALACP